MATTCANCKHPVTENFCSNCGQPAKTKRIDRHYIMHEIEHLLHIEKGFLYTAKELFIRPGIIVQNYINENRTRLTKPIPWLILTSLIYTLVDNFFHVEEGIMPHTVGVGENISSIMKWVQSHYGYANIMMGGIVALLLKLFFRKSKYNIFEITILLCFVMGEGMLILALFSAITGITKVNAIFTLSGVLAFIYTALAIGQFYEPKKLMSYVKAFIAYGIGNVLFYIIIIIIGLLKGYWSK